MASPPAAVPILSRLPPAAAPHSSLAAQFTCETDFCPAHAFSLLFRNSAPIVFAQQVYPLSHPRIGQAGIFLVPIAQERAGFLYQAVFN